MSPKVYQINLEDFPGGLSYIPDPPKMLYARGTLPPEGTKFLTVVGSRALSTYGRQCLSYFFDGLRGYPISIVSGLALGTDTLAHELALERGIHTTAMPGSGIGDDVIYPKSNRPLAKRILEHGGALLSEYPPTFRAQIWSFPKRNRVMAGIADVVFMLEAGEKSGTLITAKMASEYNRELCTIPHSLFEQNGKGPHQFIRLGATCVYKPEHLLEALGLEPLHEVSATLRPLEQKVFSLLEDPCSVEDMQRALHLPRSDVLGVISSLELKGLIGIVGGAYVRLRNKKT